MSDYQRVVDEVRSFVQGSDQTFNETLRQLASDFAAACREANERLRRCEDFLSKGLRSEAVHFARAEPSLLDVVAALDFAERQQWDDVAALYGLPAPPPLNLHAAEALNQAFAEEQPLENLLRRHRRLALARAPLAERLAVLRQILALDPGNSVWADDLAAFEKVRLGQVRGDVEQAAANRDDGALIALAQEVQQTPWVEPPPADLVELVHRTAQDSHLRHTRNALRRAADELVSAYQLRDEARARTLRDQWGPLATRAALPPGDAIARKADTVFRWLDKLDRKQADEVAYQTTLVDLEQTLNRDATAEQLEKSYAALTRFDREVPPALERRVQDRLEALRAKALMRERITLAVVFSIGVLALVGFVLFLILRSRG